MPHHGSHANVSSELLARLELRPLPLLVQRRAHAPSAPGGGRARARGGARRRRAALQLPVALQRDLGRRRPTGAARLLDDVPGGRRRGSRNDGLVATYDELRLHFVADRRRVLRARVVAGGRGHRPRHDRRLAARNREHDPPRQPYPDTRAPRGVAGARPRPPLRQPAVRFRLHRAGTRPLPRVARRVARSRERPADHARARRGPRAHAPALGVPVRRAVVPRHLDLDAGRPLARDRARPRAARDRAAAARPRNGQQPDRRDPARRGHGATQARGRAGRNRSPAAQSRSTGWSARRSQRCSGRYGATTTTSSTSSGTACSTPSARTALLLLEEDDGRSREVSGVHLGTMLADERTLRLAVLNACEGARGSADDPFAGVAASLIQREIPAVVAMQFEITDRAALVFAGEFYAAVADGYAVDAALAEARKAIYADDNDVEWATPVLFMRAPEGLVFQVASPAPRRAPEQEREPEREQPEPEPPPDRWEEPEHGTPTVVPVRAARAGEEAGRAGPAGPAARGGGVRRSCRRALQFLAVLAEWEPGPGGDSWARYLPRLGRRLPRPARTARARRRHLRCVGGPVRAAHRRLRARRARRPGRVGRGAARRRARAPGELQRLGRSDRRGRTGPRRGGIHAGGRRRRARGCTPA